MAIFGAKKKKEEPKKDTSPPQRELPNDRFPPTQPPAAPDPAIDKSHSQAGSRDGAGSMLGRPNGIPRPPPAVAGSHQSVHGGGSGSGIRAPVPPPQQQPYSIPNPVTSPPPPAPPLTTAAPVAPSPTYPWSLRQLGLLPPVGLPGDLSKPGSAALDTSPPPFPRYGHSVNAMVAPIPRTYSRMGGPPGSNTPPAIEFFIFGGLVRDQVRNDLYVLHVPTVSAALVKTTGEVPPPRVGHASVAVGNVLIVWGGDTKVRGDEVQDPGLYLLNLTNKEWTRVKVAGAMPEGRYGHAAAIIGSRFFVFGGQTDNGGFMNDLWSFDLQKLKTGAPKWSYLDLPATAPVPSKRTGHTVVTHSDFIYVFGGTDGQYHYNDTWRFDTNTGAWTELECIGYIPQPREGHSATLVGDIMYILGGRGTDGQDLDDLAAFKISNQRWYMFQNMGPGPAGRSGHAMASSNSQVFVLGGESYTGAKGDDPAILHVLDTEKIQYPDESSRGGSVRKISNAASNPQAAQSALNALRSPLIPQNGPPLNQTGLDPRRTTSPAMNNTSVGQRSEAMVQPNGMNSLSQTMEQRPQRTNSTAEYNAQDPRLAKRATTGAPSSQAQAPMRPKRDDEKEPAMNRRTIGGPATNTRAMSPVMNGSGPLQQSSIVALVGTASGSSSGHEGVLSSPTSSESTALQNRRPEPSQTQNVVSQATTSRPNVSSPTPRGDRVNPTSPPKIGGPLTNGNRAKSPSLVNGNQSNVRDVVAPTSNQQPTSTFSPRPGSGMLNGSTAHGNAEVQSLQRQMNWMKKTLAVAVAQGFVPQKSSESNVDGLVDLPKDTPDQRKMVMALLQMKQDLAEAKTKMSDHAHKLDDRLAETLRSRTAALQEASFYRAKLTALERGSAADLQKLEGDRISDLEHKLHQALSTKSSLERQVTEHQAVLEHEKSVSLLAEERANTAVQRAQVVENAHSQLLNEHTDLHNRSKKSDASVADHMEKLTSLQSAHDQMQADLEHHKTKSTTSKDSSEQYLRTLEQHQVTLLAANARADETHAMWETTAGELGTLRSTHADLLSGYNAQQEEMLSTRARSEELQRLLASTKQENEAMRALTSDSMAELVAHTRQVKHHRDSGSVELRDGKLKVLEEEVKSLKQLYQQSSVKLEHCHEDLVETKSRNVELEKQLLTLRVEADQLRVKVVKVVNESSKIRAQVTARDFDLQDKCRAVEVAEVKVGVLRNLMVENGISVDEDHITNRSYESLTSPPSHNVGGDNEVLSRRCHELESRLESKIKSHEEVLMAHEMSQRNLEQVETKYREASRKHEAAADEISSLVQEVQRLRSGGASSVPPPSSSSGHGGTASTTTPTNATTSGVGADEELSALQERHRALEQTHMKAIQYVKGTEKMLRRMKEELSKYKERTEQLELELEQSRSGGGNESSQGIREQMIQLQEQLDEVRSTFSKSQHENEELQQHITSIKSDYSKTINLQQLETQTKLKSMESDKKKFEDSFAKTKIELDEAQQLNKSLNDLIIQQKSGTTTSDSSSVETKVLENQLSQAQKQIDWLKQENVDLEVRCRECDNKISLLLDHMENTGDATSQSSHNQRNWDTSGRRPSTESGDSEYTDGERPDVTTTTTSRPT